MSELKWTVCSPLSGEQTVEGAGDLLLEECQYVAMAQVAVRKGSNLDGKSQKALGIENLPTRPLLLETKGLRWLWSGPGQWIVMGEPITEARPHLMELLREHMGSYSVSEQTSSRVYMRLSGERSRDVLVKLCRLDLDDNVFVEGSVAVTNFGHINVNLWREPGKQPAYGILVFSSLAKSLWHELCEAGVEYGMGIERFYD